MQAFTYVQVIPLLAVPSQSVNATLGGQSCRISIYQKSTGLYIDLFVNDSLVVCGVLCLNCNVLVRNEYFGFVGDLYVKDTQGIADPDYSGLGDRFILCYRPTL